MSKKHTHYLFTEPVLSFTRLCLSFDKCQIRLVAHSFAQREADAERDTEVKGERHSNSQSIERDTHDKLPLQAKHHYNSE